MMTKRYRLSGLSVVVGRWPVLIALYAVVTIVVLLWLRLLSTQAYSGGQAELPNHVIGAAGAMPGLLNASSASFQHVIGVEESWEEWTTVAHPASNNVVELRQVSATERPLDPNTSRNVNRAILSETRRVANYLVLNSTQTISVSDSYTTYLPLVMNNYTPPFCNGDFEIIAGNFAMNWEGEGALDVSITTTLSNGDLCSSGTRCALLSSPNYPCHPIPLGYGRIYQTFGVPPTGTHNLSFRYRIFSYDEYGQGRFDSFDVYIDDILPDETPPILILTKGSQDGKYDQDCDGDDLDDMGWQEFPEKGSPEFDLSAIPYGSSTVDYRGKTVRLSFYVYSRELPPRTVGWYNTWVYLDDVQVRQD